MSLWSRLSSLYGNLLRRASAEKDLDDELRASLNILVEEKIVKGMSPGEALREARIELGGVEQTKERVREARIGHFLETILRDLGYGLRLLRKSPGFATFVIATLALGIGANTAVFSIVEGAFLDPFPYDASHEIISIRAQADGLTLHLTARDVSAVRERVPFLEHVTAYRAEPMNLTREGRSVGVRVIHSTTQMFPLLGIHPILGRVFSVNDDVLRRERIAVLGHDLWQSQLSGDPDVLDKSIVLNDIPYTVIGIMPPRFQYGDGDIWTPLNMDPGELEDPQLFCHALLEETFTVEQVNAELRGIPESEGAASRRFFAVRLIDEVLDDVRFALMVLMAVAGLILLVACVNVAGLLMVRSIPRGREVAMRVALGAGRARVLRQLLTENALLALAGGVVGYVLAHVGLEAILFLIPDGYIPVEARVEVSLPMLVLTLGIATVVSVVFGTSSAWRITSNDLRESLKEGGQRILGESRGRRRTRRALVVLQVALTLVLLTSAGLLLKSFVRLLLVNPGFDPQGIVTMDITLPTERYSKSHQVVDFYDEFIRRIDAVDGVESISGSNLVPLSFWPLTREVVVEAEDVQQFAVQQVEYRQVTRDFFHTFGISLVEGRNFDVTDSSDSSAVVVVNQAFVRKLLPEGRVLGRRVRIEPRKLASGWSQIVGVVGDVKQHRFDQEADPEICQLHRQAPAPLRSLTLSMRTRLPLNDILEKVQSELHALDPTVPVLGVEPMMTFVDYGLGGHRAAAFLTCLFGALALTLTLVGLYGLIAYRVSQTAQEMGLRMALGATPRQITREIVGRGLGLVALGVGLGVLASVVWSHVLQELLFGVRPLDLATMLFVIAVVFLVTALTCYLPARRIYRLDPGAALHYE